MNQRYNAWPVAVMVIAAVAGVVGVVAVGDDQSSVLLPILVGFLAPTIASVVNLNRTDETNKRLTNIDGRLNGDLDQRIEAAVERALSKWTSPKHD